MTDLCVYKDSDEIEIALPVTQKHGFYFHMMKLVLLIAAVGAAAYIMRPMTVSEYDTGHRIVSENAGKNG